MIRSIMDYEYLTGHHAARHLTYAPFACRAPLKLCIEPNPMRGRAGDFLIVERCSYDGRIVNAWQVLPEPVRVNNDDQDDGA